MKEYRISFQPTFHDNVNLEFQIDDDFGIISIKCVPVCDLDEVYSQTKEVPLDIIQSFNKNISKTDPLFLSKVDWGGLDGITIDCYFVNDEGFSNEFSIWSPRKNDHQAHLIFINSIYNVACQVFTDQQFAKALENLRSYFD